MKQPYLFFIIIMIIPSSYALQSPDYYTDNQCELIAKDYQAEYGGSLVWIQPLKDNGAFDLEQYNAHIINKAYSRGEGVYYIDYQTSTYFGSIADIKAWYGKPAIIYDLSVERPPFNLWWHY